MAEKTTIAWATSSFNPWIGCSKVHVGCEHCYAAAMAGRLGVTWGPNGTRRRTADSTWKKVESWNRAEEPFLSWSNYKRPRVFPSLCDPFEDWRGPILGTHGGRLVETCAGSIWETSGPVSNCRDITMDDLRRDFFALIDRTPNLDWLLLTKRPENVRRMLPGLWGDPAKERIRAAPDRSNVWLIYSASDQQALEAGLPHLLACRDLVPVLGLSLEPLVGPVDLSRKFFGWDPITGQHDAAGYCDRPIKPDWVIVGGESGPKARPCDLAWVRSIVAQCRGAGVPCFVKQLGSEAGSPRMDDQPYPHNFGCRWLDAMQIVSKVVLRHPKGGDPSEWPEDLRVREFPR